MTGRVFRVDLASGEVSSTRRTSIGGVRARANLTRTGVFKYRNSDGTTRREYRPAEEVFDKDSLESLAHVPLTIGHPSRVTPETWRQLSNGHVGETHRAGKFVAADIHIEDASAAKDTEDGKLRELSCGYSCHLEPTAGVTADGEPYDGIQRRISYNHVALLPPGTGRAGADVRLHLDADDAISGEETTMEKAATDARRASIKRSRDAWKKGTKFDKGRTPASSASVAVSAAEAGGPAVSWATGPARAAPDDAQAAQARAGRDRWSKPTRSGR